ncbi:MFS transporter [Brochothrix campestris]|uniref:MFS transporter n=2 Tax=Brochothrix campestris TaxID=2757 RepID=UPI0038D1006E
MSQLKKNLYLLMAANFLVSISMTMIMPFLSLYIATFGNYSQDHIQRWSGYIFGVTFLAAFLVSPLWGKIGDRHGFKPILIFTSVGMALSLYLMGEVSSVSHLFFLRIFMGIVTGFVGVSNAFIARQTPKKESGRVLGTLQLGSVTGMLFGPLIGGYLADVFGFKQTFYLSSIALFIVALLVTFVLKDTVTHTTNTTKNEKVPNTIAYILHIRVLTMMMIATSLVQIANFSLQPLLSLYVKELVPHTNNIALLSGLAFSATGFGNLIMTRRWGILGDHHGYEKIIGYLLIGSAIAIIPMAFINSMTLFIFLRFLFGIVIGGLIPLTTAYIRLASPISIQGEVLGYNQSARFLGNVIGPVIGGELASLFSISFVFIFTAFMFLLTYCLLQMSMRSDRKRKIELH